MSVMCRMLTDSWPTVGLGELFFTITSFFSGTKLIVLTVSMVQWLTYSSPELLYAKDIKNVPEGHTEWYRASVK